MEENIRGGLGIDIGQKNKIIQKQRGNEPCLVCRNESQWLGKLVNSTAAPRIIRRHCRSGVDSTQMLLLLCLPGATNGILFAVYAVKVLSNSHRVEWGVSYGVYCINLGDAMFL